MTRVDAKDAAFFYESRPGSTTDHYFTVGLRHPNGRPLAPQDLVDELHLRLATLPHVRVRLARVPFDLDYPSWTTDSDNPRDRVQVRNVESGEWSDARNVLAEILSTPLNVEDSAILLHVIPNLREIPGIDGLGSVLVVQLSHALADGQGAVATARSLLGDASARADLPAPSTTHRHTGAAAALGLIRIPVQAGAFAAAAVRSIRSSRRFAREVAEGSIVTRPPLRRACRINATPGSDRAAAILVHDRATLTGSGLSVTTAALTSISRALTAYLGSETPSDLGAHVTVALPTQSQWSGVNRLTSASVDLFPHDTDQPAAIRTSLSGERQRVTHQAVLDSVRVAEHIPAPLLKAGLRRQHPSGDTVHAHTTVSSVNCGPATLELCGAPAVFIAGFAGLSPAMSLNHAILGLGDTISVGVVTSPSALPDHDRYVELLDRELSEVGRA